MKTFLTLVVFFACSSAMAEGRFICNDPKIQDNYYSVQLTALSGRAASMVKLRIPTGEFSGKVLTGYCQESTRMGGPSALGTPRYDCDLRTSAESGYSVVFYTLNSRDLSAAEITHYSMSGHQGAILLPNCKADTSKAAH